MKYFYLFLFLTLPLNILTSQIINFPDANFKTALLNNYPIIDTNSDSEIDISEAEAALELKLDNSEITSVDGIEHFVNVQKINLNNNDLTNLNLDFITSLVEFRIDDNPNLVTLSLAYLVSVQEIIIIEHLIGMTTLNLGSLTTVGELFYCTFNSNMSSLDIANLQSVGESFTYHSNHDLIHLDISSLVSSSTLRVNGNLGLQTIDASNLESCIWGFQVYNNNDLTALLVPNLNLIADLNFHSNHSMVNLSLPSLTTIQAVFNQQGDIYLHNNDNLTTVNFGALTEVSNSILCDENLSLTSLDFNSLVSVGFDLEIKLNNLSNIQLSNLQTVGYEITINDYGITNLDLSSLISSDSVNISANLTEIDLSNLTTVTLVNLGGNDLVSLNFPSLIFAEIISVSNNNLENISFGNMDAQISSLGLDNNNFSSFNLNYLINLESLNINSNSLTAIDVTGLANLNSLRCRSNQLTEINFGDNPNLEIIFCEYNQLTSIDVSSLDALKDLHANFNLLTEINFGSINNIEELSCSFNQLESLDISQLDQLINFQAFDNLLTSFVTSNSQNINNFDISNNLLTSLDFSELPIGSSYYNISNNNLEYLILKNGAVDSNMDFSENPDLVYVCVDEIPYEQAHINNKINEYGLTNCEVNSYCAFTPGGEFYTVFGSNYFNIDDSSCTTDNPKVSFINYKIDNGTETETIYVNNNGEYTIWIPEGEYTITPQTEYPDYFSINPSSISLSFPDDVNPYEQDFCVTPVGEYLDLEIIIIPVTPARPGFDANYKLVYRNKGNQIQSGEIRLVYNDFITEFVSASPMFDSQDQNQLFWNYSDLTPFETREIDIVFNVNSPTDNPPIEVGDFLGYEAIIFPVENDETYSDNESELKQEVVGSFDPNDKTCLEGEFIEIDMVGEYVHYLIRFENTGNYQAENIVVKDELDLDKFQIETFTPLNSSHNFFTRLNDNVVEFIFEGIDLPFEEGQNQGYVLFKIKTKESLIIGDVFTNDAEIYFDYNLPIITNLSETEIIDILGVPNFDFNNAFILYPNPSNNVLNIQNINNMSISSIEIYNITGQLIMAILHSTNQIDISSLVSGTYFIKLNSNEGSAHLKFIIN